MGAVFLAALAGVGVFVWANAASRTNEGAAGSSVTCTFPLETFVVNLSGSERGYLRVGISLGLAHAPERKEELPVALARDTILTVLSTAQAADLTGPEGKSKLKAEILQALKERAPQLGVEDVFFTEFLVQM